MLFTLVEAVRTKVEIALVFGESRKVFCCIYGTSFPRDEGEDLVTIHHPAIHRAYAEIRYPYAIPNPMHPPHSLDDMVKTGTYIWVCQMLVPVENETCAEGRESNINMNAFGRDLTVSVAATPNNINPAKANNRLQASNREGSTNALEPMVVSNKMPSAKINEVVPEKVDSAASLVWPSDDKAGKSVSVRQFRHGNYETVEVVANIDQITDVPYALR